MPENDNTFEEEVISSEENIEFNEQAAPDEMTLLKEELESLRAELRSRDELEKTRKRMERELQEFTEYFPEVHSEKIPEEIWEKVKGGDSLAASYALFIRKGELERSRISDFNKKNRKMSSGSLISDEGEKYYSPSEVKKMTPAEVKKNYDVIVESMRHWN